MISEKQLSEHFHSFWQYQFPLLNRMFVRRYNIEQVQRLHSRSGNPIPQIHHQPGIKRFDLVSEVAFEFAALRYSGGAITSTDQEAAARRAVKTISEYSPGVDVPDPTVQELEAVEALLHNYIHFFDTVVVGEGIVFRPHIKGAGILNAMEADFTSPTTLFEVKTTVDKPGSRDIRQILCYLVAGLASREYRWTSYCIFNPRLAIYYKGSASALLAYLSGRTSPECISSVLSALVEREQPLEVRF